MKNDNNLGNKKRKKINKIKEELARLREKLSASENKQSSFTSKPKLKKVESEIEQARSTKTKVIRVKSKAEEATTQTKDLPEAEVKEFDIKDLNVIDDKMARGIAKKIYTSGKRAEKSSLDIIADIRNGLNEASKMNDDVEKILNDLET